MNKKNLILGMVTALSLPAASVLHAEDAAPAAQQQSAPAYLGIVPCRLYRHNCLKTLHRARA
ncbi:hypothetical protein [Thiolapillus sp.]|uniref:hypothetical protein n=1 Tax=Thiolapillus sp. TaxID=2017437 RepID=UPI0025E4A2B7|nr:hypothetical protein [Thiolapillus sp.]